MGRSKAAVFADIGPDFDAEAAEARLRALAQNHTDDPHIQVMLARLDAGNAARLGGDLDLAAWHHAGLMKDLSQPGILTAGDNAAQWAFDLPEGVVTMDAPATKGAYALLTVSVTRYLKGDENGADEAWGLVSEFPELARVQGVLDNRLKLLSKTRPEWERQIAAFRKRFSLSTR